MMDLRQLGYQPIPGDRAAGADVRYEPEFEQLQAEIDKLSSPTASGQVDWRRVEQLAAQILAGKSKDLTVACYLAVALVCNRQVPGLAAGLDLLKGLLETFWDDLYPPKKRMRGRNGAIGWWLERTEAELQKISPAPLPAETVAGLKTSLEGIDGLLSEKLPDAPVLRSLARLIEGWPVRHSEAPVAERTGEADTGNDPVTGGPAVPPQQKTADQTPVQGPSKAPAPVTPAGDEGLAGPVNSDEDARRGADAAFQRLRQVSLFLLQHDDKNPLAYRYRRMASWAKLDALPPNRDGLTQIQPPPPQVVASLETLRSQGNLPAVIQSAEQKLSQFIFWLDLNRWVVEALADSGPEYRQATSTVCRATAELFERLPGLETLRFADGMPFADVTTRRWLQGLGVPAPGTNAAPGAPATEPQAGSEGTMADTIREARDLARRQMTVEAAALMQRGLRQSESRRQCLQWRLALAQLLMEMKKTHLALPHLDQSLADVEAYRLEEWEPELALACLMTAWQAFSAQNDSEHKARGARLLDRIARLDAAAAVRVAK